MSDNTIRKVKIVKCSDHKMWYADQLDNIYNVKNEGERDFLVRDKNGYWNIILKEDCVEVTNYAE